MRKEKVYAGIQSCSSVKNLELDKLMLVVLDRINTEHNRSTCVENDRNRTACLMAMTWEAGRRYGQTEDIEEYS